MKRRQLLNPTHWVYLLLHLVLVMMGVGLFRADGSGLLQGVGISLVAAGLSGLVVFVYVLLLQDTADRIRTITELGIQTGFAGRGARIRAEYDGRLEKLRSNLDVMGFGLRTLREDYHEQVPKWVERATVRMLLIDPEYPEAGAYADQRDTEERNAERAIRNDVHQFVHQFRDLIVTNRLNVRLYRCLPSVNVFRIDDDVFWGPYLMHQQSRNAPTLVVRRHGVLFDVIIKHFDSIWKDAQLSREVPRGWLE